MAESKKLRPRIGPAARKRDAPHADAHPCGHFQLLQAEAAHGGPREDAALSAPDAPPFRWQLRQAPRLQAQLFACPKMRARPVGLPIEDLMREDVLPLAPRAREPCLQPRRCKPPVRVAREAFGQQVGDKEARMVAGRPDLGLADHPPRPGPAFLGRIVEGGELAPARCAAETAPHPGPDSGRRPLPDQHRVFRETRAIKNARLRFAPGHDSCG